MTERDKQATDPFALVRQIESRGPAPVHLWDPPFCGDIDMVIRRDGSWWHEGRPIRRKPMLKLFASVLRLDPDGAYYLVTPVEKVRIQVEDCPFVAVLLHTEGAGEAQQLQFVTNTDETVTVDAEHPLTLNADPDTGEPHPQVHVRSGLKALIARSVFYQLVALAVTRDHADRTETGVWSCGEFYPLGAEPAA